MPRLQKISTLFLLTACIALGAITSQASADEPTLAVAARATIQKAAEFYRNEVASHGGYVYFYSLDLKQRWGEGVATKDQVWVQPPGTPTVGMAYLDAYEATGKPIYLEAATAAAEALLYGQMQSGGWTNCIDFDPRGDKVAQYRNGNGRGRNTSSLDDGQTGSAIQLLIHVDRELKFRHKEIHESVTVALKALLNAQYPNGAFPQVWDENVMPDPPRKKANYPAHDWRTEGRIKNYWDMYTLNDNVTGSVAQTLIDAHQTYKDDRYLEALKRLGDFLRDAQMPEPQPAWAQQYTYDMQPIWARKFEPPGICGDETQEVIETLIQIAAVTGDGQYLTPIPAALAYLNRSALPDGQLARYYELKTNTPLYMERQGKTYSLTHDDSNLPAHYGWKWPSRAKELQASYTLAKTGVVVTTTPVTQNEVRTIIEQLDNQGRWVSTYDGQRLVGQAKMPVGAKYLSSERFSNNLTTLSRFLLQKQ